jgi:Sushi repeat (SCR repeat)
MQIFFALTVLVCCWWMVCGIGRCPFPGIPYYQFRSSINWQNRRSFQEGEVVEYKCAFLLTSAKVHFSVSRLTCRSDGTWNNPLPRCGNVFNHLNFFKSECLVE